MLFTNTPHTVPGTPDTHSTITTNRNTLLASSSSYAFYSSNSTPAVTIKSTGSSMISVLSTTEVYSYKYYSSIGTTTSMTSTPVSTLQSSVSNAPILLVGTISTVFILLVVAILVILIVSVLVCRRRWYKTSNGNDTFSSTERKTDIDQQSDGIVIHIKWSTKYIQLI